MATQESPGASQPTGDQREEQVRDFGPPEIVDDVAEVDTDGADGDGQEEEGERGLPAGQLLAGGASVLTLGGTVLWQVFGTAALVGAGLLTAGGVVLYRGRKDKDGRMSWTRTRQTSSRMGGGAPPSFGRGGKGRGLGGLLGGGGRSGKGGGSRLGMPGLGGKGRSAGKAGGGAFGLGSMGKRGTGRGGRSAGLGGGGAARRAAQRVAGSKAGQRVAGAGRRAGAAAKGSWVGQRMAAAAKAARKASAAPSTGTKTSGNKTGSGSTGAKTSGRFGRWNTARRVAAKSLTKSRHPLARLLAQILGGLIAGLTMWRSHRQAEDEAQEQPGRACYLCAKVLADGEGEELQAIPAHEGLVPLCAVCAHEKALKRCQWCRQLVRRASLLEIEVRAELERVCPTCHQTYWSNKTGAQSPNHTGSTKRRSKGMESGFPIAVAAAEVHTVAAAYAPPDMWAVATDIKQLPDVFASVALAVRAYASRLEGGYAVDTAVVQQIGEIYMGLTKLAEHAQQIEPLFRAVHAEDLKRGETPRVGEDGWNV